MSERRILKYQILTLFSLIGLLTLVWNEPAVVTGDLSWWWCFVFLSTSLQCRLELLVQRQSPALCRAHTVRPPPKPDPPSKRLQRLAKKLKLEQLRFEWYARRLAHKRLGKAGKAAKARKQHLLPIPENMQTPIYPLVAALLILSTSLPYLCHLWEFSLLTCGYMCILWSQRIWRLVGSWMDNATDPAPNIPLDLTDEKGIVKRLQIPHYHWYLALELELWIGVVAAVTGLASLVFDSTCKWLTYTFCHEATGFVRNFVGAHIRCIDWYLRLPPVDWWFKEAVRLGWSLILFVLVYVKDSYLEVGCPEGDSMKSLLEALDSLLGDKPDVWDWKSLSTAAELNDFGENRGDYDIPPIHLVPTSFQPVLEFNHYGVDIFRQPTSKLKRRIQKACHKFEAQLDRTIKQGMIDSNSLPSHIHTEPPPTTILSGLQRFIGSFNPAAAGLDMLSVERFDRRHAPVPDEEDRVTVHLRNCLRGILQHTLSNVCMFPVFEEFVLNSMSLTTLPLIVDTGASCCISPSKEDFIDGTYTQSEVKIKDLSGSNRVAGKGMLRWRVMDRFGRTHDIEIEGYHIPRASVRLLSPQCLYKKFGGNGYQDEFKYSMQLTTHNIELDAPYGLANLPILPMNNSPSNSTWADAFLIQSDDGDIWGKSILSAKNQNLSLAEKELLLWHHSSLTPVSPKCITFVE